MAVRSVCTPEREAYATAISEVLAFLETQSGTAGGQAAAQVLLSTYNGFGFHLDPCAILRLSADSHRAAVLTVINQRILLYIEPQDVIPDGNRRFGELYERWQPDLHIGNRYEDRYRHSRGACDATY